MARALRVQYPGAIYHVTVRGIDRRMLFRDDRARERFLAQLGERVEGCEIRLYLYCLLTNHIHLVFETPQGNLSVFMQGLLTAYATYFNRRHRRTGHVTDRRYGAKLVEGDEYLDALTRYVHLNPIRVKSLEKAPLSRRLSALTTYPWSSYRAYIGRAKPPAFLECEPLLAMMGGRGAGRKRRYRQFVEAGAAENDEEFERVMKASPLATGGEAFCNKIRDMHTALVSGATRPEDAALRRTVPQVGSEQIIAIVCRIFGAERKEIYRRRRGTPLRPVVARCLCRYGGMSQRDVASLLGLRTGAAISHQLATLGKTLEHDRGLKSLVARIDQEILTARGDETLFTISRADPYRGLLLLGPTGSGKTPLGDYLHSRGLAGQRCRHFDFGARLRAAAQRPGGATLDADERAVVSHSLATGALLENDQFGIAEKLLQDFVRQHRMRHEDILVLNGLPRHAGQATALARLVAVRLVVHLDCRPGVVLARIRGNAGGDRGGREDDRLDRVRARLALFRERTAPLLDHYRRIGVGIVTIGVDIDTTPRAAAARLPQHWPVRQPPVQERSP